MYPPSEEYGSSAKYHGTEHYEIVSIMCPPEFNEILDSSTSVNMFADIISEYEGVRVTGTHNPHGYVSWTLDGEEFSCKPTPQTVIIADGLSLPFVL